jgi:hypothetical protein
MITLKQLISPIIGIGLTVIIIFIIVKIAFWLANKLTKDD